MTPHTSLTADELGSVVSGLAGANQDFMRRFPAESDRRQAGHTVYAGRHLFKADSAQKLGEVALRSLREYAPDAATLGKALGLTSDPALLQKMYARIVEKLEREPVEDFRLDFEDGYGNRADAEEDEHAHASALQVAQGMRAGSLPPFIGIRIKPFNEDLRARSFRTLDIFITSLVAATGGKLPENFVVTVPKIQIPEQMHAAAHLFQLLEEKTSLGFGSLRIEP